VKHIGKTAASVVTNTCWKYLNTWQIPGTSKVFKYYLSTKILPEYLNT